MAKNSGRSILLAVSVFIYFLSRSVINDPRLYDVVEFLLFLVPILTVVVTTSMIRVLLEMRVSMGGQNMMDMYTMRHYFYYAEEDRDGPKKEREDKDIDG